MRKKTALWMLLGILLVMVLLLIGFIVSVISRIEITQGTDQQTPLENQEAMQILAENITEIRMTVAQTEYKPDVPSFLESMFNEDATYLRIFYGYCDNGVWHDFPSENYDVIGIMTNEGTRNWESALSDHMVKIGDYLLICITVPSYPSMTCEIADSLNSPILEPFKEYVSADYAPVVMNPYPDPSETNDFCSAIFFPRYYLLLDYHSLPEDYVLTVERAMSDYTLSHTLTMDEIRTLVNGS